MIEMSSTLLTCISLFVGFAYVAHLAGTSFSQIPGPAFDLFVGAQIIKLSVPNMSRVCLHSYRRNYESRRRVCECRWGSHFTDTQLFKAIVTANKYIIGHDIEDAWKEQSIFLLFFNVILIFQYAPLMVTFDLILVVWFYGLLPMCRIKLITVRLA